MHGEHRVQRGGLFSLFLELRALRVSAERSLFPCQIGIAAGLNQIQSIRSCSQTRKSGLVFCRLLFLDRRRIVLQQLLGDLFHFFLVLFRILARVQGLGGVPVPDLLFFGYIVHVEDQRADFDG